MSDRYKNYLYQRNQNGIVTNVALDESKQDISYFLSPNSTHKEDALRINDLRSTIDDIDKFEASNLEIVRIENESPNFLRRESKYPAYKLKEIL
jgi:hypothetical protein